MRDRFCISLCVIVVGLLFSAPPSHAQNLSGELSQIGEQYADGYVAPLTDALGADLNGGLFRSADVGDGFIPGLPIDVYLGVSTSGALIPKSKKEFTFEKEQFQQNGRTITVSASTRDNQVPTIFGETNSDPNEELVYTDAATGTEISRTNIPPGLVDTPVAPFPVPQAGIGTVMGTDVQIRYLPKTSYSNYGNVGLTGLAVRHDLDQYVPGPTPLSLAIQGAWNELAVESEGSEVLNASGWAFNVQASKSLPVAPITFYGGLQYEDFSTEYNYTLQVPGGVEKEFSISQDATNNVRALAGVTLTLAIVQINVDYALSQNNTLTAGIGLQL